MMICEAVTSDASVILDLQRVAYQGEALLYPDCILPPLAQTLEELQVSFVEHLFLKAIIDDRIIGSVRAGEKNGVCQIGRLIVHPEWQRRGIGTALMAEVEKRFRHVRQFELFTGEKSEGNIRLYQRLGYRERERKSVAENLVLIFLEKLNAEHM